MSTSPNPLYSSRKDTPSESHGRPTVTSRVQQTRRLSPLPSSLLLRLFLSCASSGEKLRTTLRILAGPRASPKLAGVRGRVSSPTREKPALRDGTTSAEQTTLKVVCGLSRTRALCRSESPRECAPEESVFLLSRPLPPILPGPPRRPRTVPYLCVPSPARPTAVRFPLYVLLRTAGSFGLLSTVLRSSLR